MSGTVSLPRARLSKKSWTAPKSREWFLGFLATTGALVLLYAVALFFGDVSPAHGAGLAFGILGALLLFLCMALSLRKRFKHKQLGRTMHWLQFHMYAGTVFLLLLFLHTGFGLPSGLQTWLLFLLSLFVAVSGLVGAWLQKWIPHTMSRGLQVEAIYERIPDLIAGLRAEAEEIVKGASQPLIDFHRSELVPALSGPQPSLSFVLDVTGGRLQQMAVFTHMASRLSAAEKEKLVDLKQILLEKNNLDAQLSLQRLLRFWLYLHVPASAALTALVLVHIGAWIYY
jgi:hypothetical protein